MIRGIWFNDKHSLRDFGLYLLKPPDWGSAEPRTNYVDVPGADGKLDYTEAVTGHVTYKNRNAILEFGVMCGELQQEQLISDIMAWLHGKTVEIVDDKDADWMRKGRATVTIGERNYWRFNVRVDVDMFPYKLAREENRLVFDRNSTAEERFEIGTNQYKPTDYNSSFTFERQASSSPVPVPNMPIDISGYEFLAISWSPYAYHNETFAPYATIVSRGQPNVDVNLGEFEDLGNELRIATMPTVNTSAVVQVDVHGVGGCKLEVITTNVSKAIIQNDAMPVIPRWIVTSNEGIPCIVNGKRYTLLAGEYQLPSMELIPGENEVTLTLAQGDSAEMIFRRGAF